MHIHVCLCILNTKFIVKYMYMTYNLIGVENQNFTKCSKVAIDCLSYQSCLCLVLLFYVLLNENELIKYSFIWKAQGYVEI